MAELGKVLDASGVNMRIGSPVSEPYVFLQFYFDDPNTEVEQRYSLRLSIEQVKAIAEAYPRIKDEMDMFKTWDDQLESPE